MKNDINKTATVRVTVDFPLGDHTLMKVECSKHRLTITSLIREAVAKEIKELQKRELHERLRKSMQSAKEGKLIDKGSFAQYVEDELPNKIHTRKRRTA